ncbi:hypothetical protein D3C71_1345530 [compost metagenome]
MKVLVAERRLIAGSNPVSHSGRVVWEFNSLRLHYCNNIKLVIKMKRMVVVRNKNGSVSCLPISKNKEYYFNKYNVIVFVNKPHNYHYVVKIKQYFSKDIV